MFRRRILTVAILILIVFMSANFIVISDLCAQKKETKSKKQKPRRTIRAGEIVVRERVIKPQAMIILHKSAQAQVKADISSSQSFSKKTFQTLKDDSLR